MGKIVETQWEMFTESEKVAGGRGGYRPGAGRKPMKPESKKKVKSFALSSDALQALSDLHDSLGLSSQSAVVEYLVAKAHREVCRHRR